MAENKLLPSPSQEFKEALINTGSIIVDCQLCGRTHFGNDESALVDKLGEKEYKELLKDAKKDPDKYVQHDIDMVSWGNIDGKQAVADCQCNKLSQYESLFWKSRYVIEDYFIAKAEKQLENAKDSKNLADKVKSSVDSLD